MINNLAHQIQQLGEENIDLLARNDKWLERERIQAQFRLNKNMSELQNIISAQQIKRKLQQKNLVAVQKFGHNGNMVIDIMKISDALEYLNTTENSTRTYELNTNSYNTPERV